MTLKHFENWWGREVWFGQQFIWRVKNWGKSPTWAKRNDHMSAANRGSYMSAHYIWPASREKGPLDISNSVDQDHPTYDVQNVYTWSKWLHSKRNMYYRCDECQKVQTLARRGVGDAAAGLGLHFLYMSEGPFSHDAGHMIFIYIDLAQWQIFR